MIASRTQNGGATAITSKGRPVSTPRGFFEVTSTTLAADLHALNSRVGGSYVVIGTLVPAGEGIALCDSLRKQGIKDSPVLILRDAGMTAAAAEPEPTGTDALPSTIQIHELTIVPGRHEVFSGDKHVVLTRSELRLLAAMAARPGWVFSRTKLIAAMHGGGFGCTERTIDVHITSLRRKLGTAGRHIETIRGVGYRFASQSAGNFG